MASSRCPAPWVVEKPTTAFAKPGEAFDTSIGWRFVNPTFAAQEDHLSMPETAEEVARVCDISRADADAFAAQSQARAAAAIEAGNFASEIVPVEVKDRKGNVTVVDTDEGPRPGTTTEVLAKLRPVVKGGEVVTAGNSSSLNDGASAILVVSEAAVEKFGLQPRAKVIANANAGLAPEIMGLGPIPATRKVLERAGWNLGSVDAVELNEAFATQSWPSSVSWSWTRTRSTRGAAPLRWATRWVPPVPASRSPCSTASSRRAASAASPPCASVWARVPPSRSRGSEMFDDFQALTVTDRGDRLVVELTRPEVRNAIDDAMVSELHAVCDHLEREPKILIITGCEHKGRGIFASGADIGQLKERRREDALRGINNTIFHRIAQLPMPVIAAVDGYALGGGLELALAADFRIATEGAVRQPEANLGIIARPVAWRIKALVGEAIAKEILLAGRILSARRPSRRTSSRARRPRRFSTPPKPTPTASPPSIRWRCAFKQVMAMPAAAPGRRQHRQAILFESDAKFERMQAFLDRKKK